LTLGESLSVAPYSYASYVKVDKATGKCPDGLEPCSKSTSAKNTVCVSSFEKNYMCPITDVLIVKNEQDSIDSLTSMSYELVRVPADVNIDWVILISRDFDGPPISDF